MKKNKRIFLLIFLFVGFLAVQSNWGEGQIQTHKPFKLKPKSVSVWGQISMAHPQNKISGFMGIKLNGNPLSNWKVTLNGHNMRSAGNQYRLSTTSFSIQPGKLVKVIMTPPAGFWPRNPRLPRTPRSFKSTPIIATARIGRISKFTYPANNDRIKLRGTGGNLKVTYIGDSRTTIGFRLYERKPSGGFKTLINMNGAGNTILVPKRLLKPNRAYKMTLYQVCDRFKFNRKMVPKSYIDLNMQIDSYFVTY